MSQPERDSAAGRLRSPSWQVVELHNFPFAACLRTQQHLRLLFLELSRLAATSASCTDEQPDAPGSAVSSAPRAPREAKWVPGSELLGDVGRFDGGTLRLELPADLVGALRRFSAALDEVDAVCGARRPQVAADPLATRFRRWLIGELTRQAGGSLPRPWRPAR